MCGVREIEGLIPLPPLPPPLPPPIWYCNANYMAGVLAFIRLVYPNKQNSLSYALERIGNIVSHQTHPAVI